MTEIAFRGKGKNNDHRKFPGERGPRQDRAELKRAEAAERNTYWAGLSRAEQIAALDRRLGKGIGAKRQRARLAAKKAA